MKLENFIVVDQKIPKGKNFYTVTGEVYVPLGRPLPVIVKGKGCIGLGIVDALHITSSSTEIEFTLEKDISIESRRPFYDLYRNSSDTNGSDRYDNTDALIPGAMGNNRANEWDDYDSYDNNPTLDPYSNY